MGARVIDATFYSAGLRSKMVITDQTTAPRLTILSYSCGVYPAKAPMTLSYVRTPLAVASDHAAPASTRSMNTFRVPDRGAVNSTASGGKGCERVGCRLGMASYVVSYKLGGHTVRELMPWQRPNIGTRVNERFVVSCCVRQPGRVRLSFMQGPSNRDHVHMLLSIPSSLAVSRAVQYLKRAKLPQATERVRQLGRRYWSQHLWVGGY